MELNKLHIQNFLSTRDIDLDLNNRGLVLIQGKNMDDDNFDNNGAGKSTITEAISYVFYGKTLRGLKADEVIHNIPKKNCCVSIDLTDDDGTKYRISRYRKHLENHNNVLVFKNGKNITPKSDKDTNDFIVSLIQMDFLTFTSSILYSEQSFKFTSATDSEMKSAFDTMLGFDVLNKLQEVTKQKLDGITKTISSSESRIEYLVESQQLQMENIEEYKVKWKEADEVSKETIHKLTTELKQTKLELETHLSTQSDNTEQINTLDELINKVSKKLDKYKETEDIIQDITLKIRKLAGDVKNSESLIKSLEQQRSSSEKSKTKCEAKIELLNEQKQDISDTIGTPCPTCGAKLTSKSVQAALDKVDIDIKDYEDTIQEHDDAIVGFNKQIKDTQTSISENNSEIEELEATKSKLKKKLVGKDDLEDNMEKLTEQKLDLQAETKQFNRIKDALSKSIEKIETQITEQKVSAEKTYKPLIESAKEKCEAMRAEADGITAKIESTKQEQKKYEFWVKAFSNQGIKSKLLDDITPYLNRRANKYLCKLTSNSIEVKFSTQTTLKNKEKREKFSIEIINKNGGNQYIGNSGGERKRIDIAINMALQDLVASRSNKQLNIAFYDEVFDALDATGCERVIEVLQEVAVDKSSIFVITHNDLLKSFFDNSITIVKSGGYSKLLEE